MKDFLLRNKVFIAAVAITLLLVIGGVFLFSKNGSSTPSNKISDNVLNPSGSYETSGVVNGKFQDASNSATVTIVEFGDYQCPACGAYNPLVDQFLTDFAGKINFVFRDFAFIGAESTKAAEAAGCASDQNKFWEYHEYLYTHQGTENSGAFADENLKTFAKSLGLDTQLFGQCLDSEKYKDKVGSGTNDGNLAGVSSTPSFFINGVKIDNPANYADLKKLIQDTINNASSSGQ